MWKRSREACCVECFENPHARRLVLTHISKRRGACRYCGSEAVFLCPTSRINEEFEHLLRHYQIFTGKLAQLPAKSLVDWIQDDWNTRLAGHLSGFFLPSL